MKAIPTTYRGTPFRSRLEAQWAEFFDTLALAWQYEPEGYANGAIRYLPDFWLPGIHHRGRLGGVFFEVKASSPLSGEVDKAVMLACGSGKPVIVVQSSPRPDEKEFLLEYVFQDGRTWEDQGLEFAGCDNCGGIDIGFYSSDEPVCSCGKDRFHPSYSKLCHARNLFPRMSRWTP